MYNAKSIESKNHQIAALVAEQKETKAKINKLTEDIGRAQKQAKAADESTSKLMDKVDGLDKQNKQYQDKIKDARNVEENRNVLDTRLPDDIKRLLNEAAGTTN